MFISRAALRKVFKAVTAASRTPQRAYAEPLEQRCFLSATTLTNGSGPGSLSVRVDSYGAYGSATLAGDADYTPTGATTAGTTFQSGLFFTPISDFLTDSGFANSEQPSIGFTSQTSDTATSEFNVAGFHVALTQNVGAISVDGTTILTQQYVFTNNNGSLQNFGVVRHVDGDMFFQGDFSNDFAGVSADGRFVFEFDTASDQENATAFFGITSTGGTPAGFTIQPFPYTGTLITQNGIPSSDLNHINGDLNNDRITDSGYDVTVSLADTFSLGAGQSVTYTSTTVFGQGTASDIIGAGAFRMGANTTVNEDAGTATITVGRVGGFAGAVSVDIATADGTAQSGLDYTAVSTTLNFADGELFKTVTVPILDDSIFEGNETLNLVLSNPTGGATLGEPSTSTLTIADNESLVQFAQPTFIVSEGAGQATITVTRSTGAGSGSVDFATSDGTATAGNDYTASSGTITFASGETSRTFQVPIIHDTTAEGDEALSLTLSNAAGGCFLGSPSTATLTIDESPTVSSVHTVATGSKINAVVLTFSEPMDGASAESLSAYSLVTRGKDGRFATGKSNSVKLRRAVFDSVANSVTLTPKNALKANTLFQLTIKSALSATDVRFNRIDGDVDGNPGGDYRVFIGRGTKLSYIERKGDEVNLQLRHGGVMELIRNIDGDAESLSLFDTTPGVSVLSGSVKIKTAGGDGVTPFNSINGLNGVDNELDPKVFIVAS